MQGNYGRGVQNEARRNLWIGVAGIHSSGLRVQRCCQTGPMDARALAEPATTVHPSDDLGAALRTLAVSGLPGLVVQTGGTFVVVPTSQVLRGVLPRYVLDDPALGRVWDEDSADGLATRLAGKRVDDLIAALDDASHVVDADATVVEIAAVMAASRVPLIAVVDANKLLGVVTANRLIQHLLP